MLHSLPLEAQAAVRSALDQEHRQEVEYQDAIAHGQTPQEITQLITGI